MALTLKDRYEIDLEKNLLGKGGFGNVYKCYDSLLEKQVSAKIITASAYLIHSIRREFQIVAKLRHQNIIGYYDLIDMESQEAKKSQLAIIMDFANFGTLHDLIYKGNLKIESFTEILIGTLDGLKYIHNKGIIHRDLKPANILIHKDNLTNKLTPIISDFLSSQYLEKNYDAVEFVEVDPERTQVYGTIEYMAPERYDDLSLIGPMTDLWSIGIITYEFFKRELPFKSRQDASFFDIAKSIIVEDIEISNIPSPFAEIINICLVKDLSSRVSDVDVILKLLSDRSDTPLGDFKFKEKIENSLYKVELLTMNIEEAFIKQVQDLKNEIRELKNEKNQAKGFNKTELFALIKDNKIENCFATLSEFESRFDRSEKKSLIILQSQWNDIKHKERVGIVAADDVFILHNKIRNHLIDFITELDVRSTG